MLENEKSLKIIKTLPSNSMSGDKMAMDIHDYINRQ